MNKQLKVATDESVDKMLDKKIHKKRLTLSEVLSVCDFIVVDTTTARAEYERAMAVLIARKSQSA